MLQKLGILGKKSLLPKKIFLQLPTSFKKENMGKKSVKIILSWFRNVMSCRIFFFFFGKSRKKSFDPFDDINIQKGALADLWHECFYYVVTRWGWFIFWSELWKNQECSQFGGVSMRKLVSIIISKIHLHFDWIEMDWKWQTLLCAINLCVWTRGMYKQCLL